MIEIEVEVEAWTGALPDAEAVVERAAQAALGAVQGDIVVLLTDDDAVRDLNARFRDKDRPTNVLSFPAPELPELLGAARAQFLPQLRLSASLGRTFSTALPAGPITI